MQTVYGFYLAMNKESVDYLCCGTNKRICSFAIHRDIIDKLDEIHFIDEVNKRCNSICNEWDTDTFEGEQLLPLKTYLEELIDQWKVDVRKGDDFFDFLKNLYLYVVFAVEHDTAVGFVL